MSTLLVRFVAPLQVQQQQEKDENRNTSPLWCVRV